MEGFGVQRAWLGDKRVWRENESPGLEERAILGRLGNWGCRLFGWGGAGAVSLGSRAPALTSPEIPAREPLARQQDV